jgi:hypothetical protein
MHIVFVGPAHGNLNVFVAHQQGDEIVQEGTGTSGKPARWIFSENSFRWRDEVSDEGGKTWKLREEMHARRQAQENRKSSDASLTDEHMQRTQADVIL